MSLVQANNLQLIPDSEVIANDRQIADNKLNLDIYCNEGNSAFGYGFASAQRQISFTIGSQNCAWLPSESFIELDIKLAAGTTACIPGDVSALFDRVRLVTQAGAVLVN